MSERKINPTPGGKGWIPLTLKKPTPDMEQTNCSSDPDYTSEPLTKWIHAKRIMDVNATAHDGGDGQEPSWIAHSVVLEDGRVLEVDDIDGRLFYFLTGMNYSQTEAAARYDWDGRFDPEPKSWYATPEAAETAYAGRS